MKTVRFASLVESAGHPDTHLMLMKPEDDRTLQKAIKAHRVVTVFQHHTGNRTDHGEVGFNPGPNRQYLVFPKSAQAFEGRRIVGIKYELLESEPIPKNQRAERPSPKRKPVSRERKATVRTAEKHDIPPEKVVNFPQPENEEDDESDESEAIEEIKVQVKKAMGELEKGKQVAAFNLLKRIVGD